MQCGVPPDCGTTIYGESLPDSIPENLNIEALHAGTCGEQACGGLEPSASRTGTPDPLPRTPYSIMSVTGLDAVA